MYQPYPTSGSPQEEPQRIEPPSTVRSAVKLMYAGAAVGVIAIIIGLLSRASLKSSILAKHPDFTTRQLHAAEAASIVVTVIGGLIAIGLWIWMAWANGHGRSWARVLSAVFFGINTLGLIVSLAVRSSVAEMHTAGSLIVGVVVWLIGLAAIVLIFNKKSGPFYQQQ
jgi:hypothetical protein